MKVYKTILALGWVLLPLWGFGQKAFKASLSKEKIGVDESFKVTFTLSGRGSNFRAPDFQFFKVLFGPSTSIKRQNINGNYAVTESYSFKLQPTEKGQFEIGPARIDYRGKTLETEPQKIEVVNEGKTQERSGSIVKKIRNRLFIKCTVDERNPYKGEQITATYKLFLRDINVTNDKVLSKPKFNAFWKKNLIGPRKNRYNKEKYKGKTYRTTILKKTALFPQRNGELTLDPYKIKVRVRYRNPNKRRGFFGRAYESKTLNVANKPVTIDVKPLPGKQPSSFSGLVGNFEMKSSLDKRRTMTNKPVSLKISINGQGNLKLLQPFDLNLLPAFESYSPNVDANMGTRNDTVKGSKTFEYLLMPRSSGRHKIDPIAFTYFNPEKEQYVTKKTPKYTVRVKQGVGDADSMVKAGQRSSDQKEVETADEGIRNIKTNAGNLEKTQNTFAFSGFFWGLTLAPVLFLSGLVFYRRRRAKQLGQPIDVQSKKAQKLARQKLKTAKKHLDEKNPDGFYGALSEAMWGYAGDKMNIPMAELTQDHIREALQHKEISDQTIEEFLQIIDDCEQARFAPSSANFDMEMLYTKAESAILSIEHQLP